MFSNNNKISVRQLNRMLVFDLFSISSLIIPYLVTTASGRDGLICIIIGTVLTLFYSYIMIWFGNRAEDDYLLFSKKTVGSIITFLFGILYCFKLFFSCVFSVGLLAEIINETLLTDTNYKFIIIAIIFVISYAAYKGIEVRARIAELLYYLILVPLFFAFILGMMNIEITNIMPLFTEKASHLISGSYQVLLAYSGVEFILFVIPFTHKEKKVVKEVTKSIITVGVLNIIIFIATVGFMGVYATKEKLWSVIDVMQVIELPGGLVQRQDGILIGFFIISTFILLSTFIYYLSSITSKIIQVKDYRFFIVPFGILLFLVVANFVDIKGLFQYYQRYMMYIGMPQSIIIPIIIFIVASIRGTSKKDMDHHKVMGKDVN